MSHENSLSPEKIQVSINPQEFFRNQVTSALSNQKISIEEDLEFYLVNLLCKFIDPRQTMAETDFDPFETPLAFLFKKALESSPETKQKLFRSLGDICLYFSGFFQDYFNRKTYDIDYFMTLGGTAYSSLANLLRDRRGEGALPQMYSNLAVNFHLLVDIVAEVSAVPGINKSDNILAVYDRWTKCNSQRLRKQLESWGITPIPIHSKMAQ